MVKICIAKYTWHIAGGDNGENVVGYFFDEANAKKALSGFAKSHLENNPFLYENKFRKFPGTLKSEQERIEKELTAWGHSDFSIDNHGTFMYRFLVETSFVADADSVTLKKAVRYYGVEQYSYGSLYRWIYDEETLCENIYDGGMVPDEDGIDCSFPITGSNSSSTFIRYIGNDSDEDLFDKAAAFLVSPGESEFEDPHLSDVNDFYVVVRYDNDSCTSMFVSAEDINTGKFSQADDNYHRRERALKMIEELQAAGYDKLCYDTPLYTNEELTFNELCDIYKNVTGKDVI